MQRCSFALCTLIILSYRCKIITKLFTSRFRINFIVCIHFSIHSFIIGWFCSIINNGKSSIVNPNSISKNNSGPCHIPFMLRTFSKQRTWPLKWLLFQVEEFEFLMTTKFCRNFNGIQKEANVKALHKSIRKNVATL